MHHLPPYESDFETTNHTSAFQDSSNGIYLLWQFEALGGALHLPYPEVIAHRGSALTKHRIVHHGSPTIRSTQRSLKRVQVG